MGFCERCKKAQATFHLTQIESGGEKIERHLCEQCALDEGLLQMQKPTVNVQDVLQSFVASAKAGPGPSSDLMCGNCGLSYIEFRNQGLLGCAEDYDVFRDALAPLIGRAHDGATSHTGKTPRSLGQPRTTQQDLRKLRRQLEEAIRAEDYERAAELRDRLHELENA